VNNSCLLTAVEEMDVLKDYVQVLKEFPQQPHFLPLQQYPETILKGMKLGVTLRGKNKKIKHSRQ
jgi:hypothetical protein